MKPTYSINIGKEFSRFPAGRYEKDGPTSGEEFREKFLIPLLNKEPEEIVIELDDAIGYGSSFLEEAFGGLVRRGWKSSYLIDIFKYVTDDLSLSDEIVSYIREAK